ncbi:PLP-dependent transferase [Tuber magnatum]|uniref:aromatic-amino-acid transaminase n=1 Tax=Tuber magnatum TaxID=42249 RepID=A0A317SWZ1_9PEZI|nr:PLP-dependent transferase [Tuber magnatum]
MAPPSKDPPNHQDADVRAVTDTPTVELPSALTCAGVPARRLKSGVFNGGVAAATSSEFFKSKSLWKPLANKWDHRLSKESKSRKASSLKGAAKYLAKPGIISLGGGLPSSDYFPFEHIEIRVPTVGQFSEEETKINGQDVRIGKHDVPEGKSAFDLAIALNYGQGTGSAQMLRFVTEHTEIVHNPPYQDWQCIVDVGSTYALDTLYRMFCERGDYVISEEYTFATAVETAAPLGVKFLGVKIDDEGLIPEDLDQLLENWDDQARGGRKPYVLYTVPSGQNPTGSTQGRVRRQEIYRVAQKHDLLIIEDEPYYFLQMQPYTGPNAPPAPLPATHEEFLNSLVPSLLKMDVDGRVIRMDSFSKVISPGSRLGWITATSQICERFIRNCEVSAQNPSGFSQVILHRLLDEHWGHAGYLDWLIFIRKEYTQRRDIILQACEKYLPKELASWNPPAAGMFQWIKIAVEKHPDFGKREVVDIEDDIFQASVGECVLLSPGSWFAAERGVKHTALFFRATFAAAAGPDMTEAIRRFSVALKRVFKWEENEQISV